MTDKEIYDAIRDRMKASLVSKAQHFNNDVSFLLNKLEEAQKTKYLNEFELRELQKLRNFSHDICMRVMEFGVGPTA